MEKKNKYMKYFVYKCILKNYIVSAMKISEKVHIVKWFS